jgi:shikimate dehydrogenase
VKLYGLIGFPLTHSFSQKYFTEKFAKEKITDCQYKLFPLGNLSELQNLLSENKELKGINVTIPFKEKIIPYLNELDIAAQEIGAVNTISIVNGKLKGYNTDVYGFQQSIKPFLESHHQRALVFGTGGASKAICYVLNKIGIDYFLVSRNPKNEKEIAYTTLNQFAMESCPLIINTTPLGMYPNVDTFPPIPYEFLTDKNLLFDVVYNPLETIFLQKGKAKKSTVISGLNMLYLQAEKSWDIWNNNF